MTGAPSPRAPSPQRPPCAAREISELLALAGGKQTPVRGGLDASMRLSGTVANPNATADVTVTKGVAYDQPFDKLQAGIDYSPLSIAVRKGQLTVGDGENRRDRGLRASAPVRRLSRFSRRAASIPTWPATTWPCSSSRS